MLVIRVYSQVWSSRFAVIYAPPPLSPPPPQRAITANRINFDIYGISQRCCSRLTEQQKPAVTFAAFALITIDHHCNLLRINVNAHSFRDFQQFNPKAFSRKTKAKPKPKPKR